MKKKNEQVEKREL